MTVFEPVLMIRSVSLDDPDREWGFESEEDLYLESDDDLYLEFELDRFLYRLCELLLFSEVDRAL